MESLESSGRAVSKTVPGFEFRATFEGDIEGFRPVKVLVATTVCDGNLPFSCKKFKKNSTSGDCSINR